jgi:hypothetical protein
MKCHSLLLATAACLALVVPAKSDTFDFSALGGVSCGRTCGFNWFANPNGTGTKIFSNTGVQTNPWTIGTTTLNFQESSSSNKIYIPSGAFFGSASTVPPHTVIGNNNSAFAGMFDLGNGNPMYFNDPSGPFILNDFYVGWTNAGTGSNITVNGYLGGVLVDTATFTLTPDSGSGGNFMDLTFNWAGVDKVTLPSFFGLAVTDITTNNPVAVPGPVAGAGIPGLIAACGGLLALARRRRQR